MKKFFILGIYLTCAIALYNLSLHAAPGDTIKIVSHQQVEIATNPSVGNTYYPSWVNMPNTQVSIAKVILKMNLSCPPGKTCGEWDYLNHIWLRRKGSAANAPLDIELARFITPYGNSYNSSFKAEYKVDVSDWEWLLRGDSVEIEYNHSGYETNVNKGWLINLEWQFIEGPAYRNFISFEKLWNGSFPYGNSADPIENYLTPRVSSISNTSTSQRIRIVQTGHGADNSQYCAEFCSKWRKLFIDGTLHSQKQVWRDDCGSNPLPAQAGTWLYDRAGWCPGAFSDPDVYDLSLSPNTTPELNIDMETFINNDASQNPNYVIQAYLFQYGDIQFQTDASIEQIARPSTEFEFNRLNPICSNPLIRIRNNGKNELTTVRISYGVTGGPTSEYVWSGTLSFMESAWVELPSNVVWTSGSGNFKAEIIEVNGSTDQIAWNNIAYSSYKAPAIIPERFVVSFKSNSAAHESSWKISDANGQIIAQRNTAAPNTLYNDTLDLSPGCYVFEMEDSDKDGLKFFANGDGNGSIRFARADQLGTLRSFNPDFGTFIHFSFMVKWGLDNPEESHSENIQIYPNPATDILHIRGAKGYSYTISDTNGKKIKSGIQNEELQQLSISELKAGIYVLKLENKKGVQTFTFICE